MSLIKILQAKHGDSFIIHCQKGGDEGIVVVDGGPTMGRSKIRHALDEIGSIDLMILTHYDDDHIGGIVAYIKGHADDLHFPVKELWVNCARHIDFNIQTDISFTQANNLATYLSEADKDGKLTWKEYVHNGYVACYPFADITVISPTLETQDINKVKYEAFIKEKGLLDCSAIIRGNDDLKIPLEELAKRKKNVPSVNNPNELANMASISFILESDDLKLLMLGDSYPQMVAAYLQTLGYSKTNKLKVDYVKVSHHGSRNNTSNELLDLIECNKYIISTNGGRGTSYHPDRETLANILCHSGRDKNQTVHFYFNYPLSAIEERCSKLFNDREDSSYNFMLHPLTTIL